MKPSELQILIHEGEGSMLEYKESFSSSLAWKFAGRTGIRRIIEDAKKHQCPEPKFKADGFFTATFWPTTEQVTLKIAGQGAGQVTGQVVEQVGPYARKILELCVTEQPMRIIGEVIGISKRDNLKPHLTELIEAELLEMTIPDKPRSSRQRYRTTNQGRKVVELGEQVTPQDTLQVTLQGARQVTGQVVEQVGPYGRKILELCVAEQPMRIIGKVIGISKRDNVKRHLTKLIEAGLLEMTIPDKPRSSRQRYGTTDLGRKALQQWTGEK